MARRTVVPRLYTSQQTTLANLLRLVSEDRRFTPADFSRLNQLVSEITAMLSKAQLESVR